MVALELAGLGYERVVQFMVESKSSDQGWAGVFYVSIVCSETPLETVLSRVEETRVNGVVVRSYSATTPFKKLLHDRVGGTIKEYAQEQGHGQATK